ncbi:hypothetical protein I79_017836 [Cricetulus griseus]|uniref:Uncharacterized protein n=1 Tax=Cricetulus griseus TaxID=10029 RepID=G3I336_CRIGR|nr:hypothetical protein I79_017836 [Cricetulus griseus]
MGAQTCNPSTLEAEAGGLKNWKSICYTVRWDHLKTKITVSKATSLIVCILYPKWHAKSPISFPTLA